MGRVSQVIGYIFSFIILLTGMAQPLVFLGFFYNWFVINNLWICDDVSGT